MGALVLVGIAVVGTLSMWALSWARYGWTRRSLGAFAGRLEDAELRLYEGWWLPSLPATSLEGSFDGRRVRLWFREASGHGTGWSTVHLRYAALVRNPAGSFEVSEADLASRLGRWLGMLADVPTGNARVDDAYVVRGGAEDVGELLQRGSMEQALETLRSLGLPRLRLSPDGVLEAEKVRRPGDTSPDALERVFEVLTRVAALCERREVAVRVLGDRRRFAWTGGSDAARCPYCRDAIDLDGPGVTACDACDTVHHGDCFAQAGGCTVLGCFGGERGSEPRREPG